MLKESLSKHRLELVYIVWNSSVDISYMGKSPGNVPGSQNSSQTLLSANSYKSVKWAGFSASKYLMWSSIKTLMIRPIIQSLKQPHTNLGWDQGMNIHFNHITFLDLTAPSLENKTDGSK